MKTKIILAILLIITIFITACSNTTEPLNNSTITLPTETENTCGQNGSNSTQESCALPREVTQTEATTPTEESTTTPEYGQLQTDYTILEIENNINEIMQEKLAYHEIKEHPNLIFGNARKSVIIAQIDQNIGDQQEFLNLVSAPNYNVEKIYLGDSKITTLHNPLTEKDTKYFQEYKKTKLDVLRIENEQSFDLNNGKVLEYQLQYLKTDEFDNFKGLFAPSTVIYKVYCGPHMVLFLKPDWIEMERGVGGTVSDAQSNFQEEISHLRKDMLNKADKLFKKCPVTYSFFEDMQDINTHSQTKLAYDRRIYWERQANVSIETSIKATNNLIRNETTLDKIKINIKNNDQDYIHEELYIDVIAQADNGPEKTVVPSKLLSTQGLNINEEINREFFSEYQTKYENTLKLKVLVHRTKNIDNIKPMIFTFDRNGNSIKEQAIEY